MVSVYYLLGWIARLLLVFVGCWNLKYLVYSSNSPNTGVILATLVCCGLLLFDLLAFVLYLSNRSPSFLKCKVLACSLVIGGAGVFITCAGFWGLYIADPYCPSTWIEDALYVVLLLGGFLLAGIAEAGYHALTKPVTPAQGCGACNYDLANLPEYSDGSVMCPECGAKTIRKGHDS